MEKRIKYFAYFLLVILSFSGSIYAEVDKKIKKEKGALHYVCEELCRNISLVRFVFHNSTKIDITSVVATPRDSLLRLTSTINDMRTVEVTHSIDDGATELTFFSIFKDTITVRYYIKKDASSGKLEVDVFMVAPFIVYRDKKYCSEVDALACMKSIFSDSVIEVVAPNYLFSMPKLKR